MSAAQTLLALLEREPAHGYTLKHRYDERFARTRPLAFGQVYASLARFEKHGWATVVDVESGEGPERKRYQITPEGVTAVDEWVFEPQQPAEFSSSNLFARVSVALMSGRPAEQVLSRQRDTHLARMRELTAARQGADPAELLAITYELAHLDADLRWIEDAGARLAQAKDALVGES
ncbi:MAG TPA: PadR family transcriptional regulator [Marmoricola sp.]|nr:PadR family transcriptional regulator [Marmoricola sp.]